MLSFLLLNRILTVIQYYRTLLPGANESIYSMWNKMFKDMVLFSNEDD
jgi:hypothetical protein